MSIVKIHHSESRQALRVEIDGATRLPQHTVAEAITLPRIPWAEIPSSIIDVVITEAAEAGDKVLVHRARAALARRYS